MRIARNPFFAVLVLLALTGASYGQFGRLKSLAKEKLGIEQKQQKQADQNQAQPAGTGVTSDRPANAPSENEGEAKAIKEPGAGVNLNVRRRGDPTPEAKIAGDAKLASGSKQEITLTIANFNANAFGSVRSYKPCNHLSDFKIISATTVKLTIDLPESQHSGNCVLQFRGDDSKYIIAANINYLGTEDIKRARRSQEMQEEMAKGPAYRAARAKQRLGKVWAVEFADGKKDTWKLVAAPQDGGPTYKFKNAAGKPLEITYHVGNVMISMGGDCMMQGTFEGEDVDGIAMSDACGVPTATKWHATIQR